MIEKEKVFVTGADGMLGSSICRELLSQGYAVKGMILHEKPINVLEELDVEIVIGDILNKELLLNEFQGCDYVIHAAALTNVWPRKIPKVVEVNLEGTRNVMNAAKACGIKRMVHIGTANTFGHGSKENPGNESTPCAFDQYGLDYVDSKVDAQKMLLTEFASNNFPIVIINPTYMIGPFDSGPTSGKMILELVEDRLPGYSDGGKNFVCSSDVATATANALKQGRLGECYIAANENLTFKEFFQKVCVAQNKKFKLLKVPGFFVLILGFFNSAIAKVTGKPPQLSFTMARMAIINQFYSSKKAQNELNMPQTPIEEGINKCVNWFRENGFIDKT